MPVADVDLALQPLYASNSSQQQISYYSEAELQAERAMAAAQHSQQSGAPQAAATTQSALSSLPSSRRSSMSAVPVPASSSPRARSTSSATAASLGSPSAALSSRRVFDFGRGSSSHEAAAVSAASSSAAPAVDRRRSVAGSTGASPLQWSLPTLLQSLPIQPGQEVDVVVRMQAKQEWSEHASSTSRCHSAPLSSAQLLPLCLPDVLSCVLLRCAAAASSIGSAMLRQSAACSTG